MSLLLEALKKAELAKQASKADASPAEPAPPEPVTQVITREKLPDISQPLEILTDDLPSSEQKTPAEEPVRPALTLQAAAGAQEPRPNSSPGEPVLSGARAQAQQMFEVKEMDYNPRRPFYLTLGLLALVGIGYSGYIWWQLRPKSSVAAPPSGEVQARPAAPPAVAATPAPVAQAQPAESAVAAPSAPIAPSRPSAAARPAPRPTSQGAAAASRLAFRGRAAPPAAARPGPAAPATQPEPLAPVAIHPPVLVVDPLLQQAYEAYQRGDLAAARDGYQRVLAREPYNRDALLGLAAIDLRTRNFETAEARYLKLLELDPRDTYAEAGLIALRAQLDPVISESRLKTLIGNRPEATHLRFILGNQYAQQSRWNDAQAEYFKAYSADPENADYAFNLAVSLDQLRQSKLALEYYERALELAQKRPGSFDQVNARARVQELGK